MRLEDEKAKAQSQKNLKRVLEIDMEIEAYKYVQKQLQLYETGIDPYKNDTPKTEATCKGEICFPVKGKGPGDFINIGTYDWSGNPHAASWRSPSANAVDILASKGTAVYAIANGTVVESYRVTVGCGDGQCFGEYIVIGHGDKKADGTYPWYSVYAHMVAGSRTVTKGQEVQAGDKIGKVGNTGTQAYHLHFEITDQTPSAFFNDFS